MAPYGNDANPGTAAAPLATLDGARARVRYLKQLLGLPPGGIALIHTRGRAGIPVIDPAPVSAPLQTFTVDQASGDVTLAWDLLMHPGTFSVLSTTDLSLPLYRWTTIDNHVATLPYTIAGAVLAEDWQFYAVVPNGS